MGVAALEPGPPVTYTLRAGAAPTTCGDAGEPDSAASPRSLVGVAEGDACAGDEDWLRVEGPAGAPLALRLEVLGGEGVEVAAGGEAPEAVRAEARLDRLIGPTGVTAIHLAPLGAGASWRLTAVVGEAGTTGVAAGRVTAVDRPLAGEALAAGGGAGRGGRGRGAAAGRLAGRGLVDGRAASRWPMPARGAFEVRLLAAVEGRPAGWRSARRGRGRGRASRWPPARR
ncbi:MAG: hypothetical protein R3F60_25975 [bacterium]